MAPSKFLILIAGPTAVGKTALAIDLARHYSTEIISADSRQVYRELNIGVARPAESELEIIPHHFIACKSIHDYFSAGEYERECTVLLDLLFQKKKAVVLCGGTGLYIKAVCDGFDEIPEVDPEIRERLNTERVVSGIVPLQKKLQELDPETYAAIDIQNTQRVIRALEICIGTGKPVSVFRKGKKAIRNFIPIKIGLELEREELYRRIDQRVNEMLQNGLAEEARAVYPYKSNPALLTVGYREWFDHFDGKISAEEVPGQIKQHSRNYAKRQLTWFKKDKAFSWFQPEDTANIIKFIDAKMSS